MEPISSFFVSLFASLAHDQLKGWFKDNLGKQLTRTCKTWLQELPPDQRCQPEALFSLDHDALLPFQTGIQQTLKAKRVPAKEAWADLFKARWRLVVAQDGEKQPLFQVDEALANAHFDDLGQRLFDTCHENTKLFQTTLRKLADDINAKLDQLLAMMQQTQAIDPLEAYRNKPLILPDDIPPIKPPSSGSRVRYGSEFLLVGRDEALKQIAANFSDTDGHIKPRLTILTGMGGLGKTHLANAFVHHYGHLFPGGVFWLSFADADQVAAEVTACVEMPNATFEQRLQAVRSQWVEGIPRLLVFDNCEDPKLLKAWRPMSGACRVLVTARKSDWKITNTIQLETLDSDQGVLVLTDLCKRLDLKMAENISKALGGLPLALHLAGSFLDHYSSVSPKDYLEAIQQDIQHVSLQGRGAQETPTEHELHLVRTFEVSFQKLHQEQDSSALNFLARAACFAPGEPIPNQILLATLEGIDILDAEDALIRLTAVGLLEPISDGKVRLHRLLSLYVGSVMDTKEAKAAVEKTAIDRAYKDNMSGLPQRLREWFPHLVWITDHASDNLKHRAQLLVNLAFSQKVIGDYQKIDLLYQEAIKIQRDLYGEFHPETAKILGNIGSLRYETGNFQEAMIYYHDCLNIYRAVFGDEHPDTGVAFEKIGGLLKDLENFTEAWLYYQKALDIFSNAYGENHTNTANCLNNLGALYRAMHKLPEAQECYIRALSIRRIIHGDNHPDTALSYNSVGLFLYDIDKLDKALPYLQKALEIRRATLGNEHPYTGTSLNNLGALLSKMGNIKEALPYLLEGLEITYSTVGKYHKNTALSLNNLGGIYQSLNELEKAQFYLQKAQDIWRETLGTQHTNYAYSLNNMATLKMKLGDYENAERCLTEALGILEERLGMDHPNTKAILNNLGSVRHMISGSN